MEADIKPPLKEIIEAPADHFRTPVDVLHYPGLSDKDKKRVLDAWENDARRLSVATEEGMGGGEPSRLAEVAEAKAELGLGGDRKPSPTKVG
jgi:hypothetical protein